VRPHAILVLCPFRIRIAGGVEPVPRLALDGMLFEVEAVAVLD